MTHLKNLLLNKPLKFSLFSRVFINSCGSIGSKHIRKHSNHSQVRVRFAPSPTGHLHLGGLRSALYNHFFARSNNGKFILRIEDTDQARLVPGAMEKLIDMLEWSGIQIDEGPTNGGPFGPYIQTERKSLYQDMIKKLLENGTAYPCFCSQRRLDLMRKDAMRRREVPKYDNKCRHLTADEVEEKLASGVPHVVRLKLTQYKEAWPDLVYGPIVTDVASIEGDPVLMKSDGYPTYHFANVVDDHMMQITHVLRGVEWQVSTTKHILLYKAFGWTPPKFAHLPLLVSQSGKKLSKRDDAIRVDYYRAKGYFPETLQSFLCLTGSGFNVPNSQIPYMEPQQLIDSFELSQLNTNPTRLEFDQLNYVNYLRIGSYMRGPRRKQIVNQVRDLLQNHYSERQVELDQRCLTEDYIAKVLEWTGDERRIEVLYDVLQDRFQFLWLTTPCDILLKSLHEICQYLTPQENLTVAIEATKALNDKDVEDVLLLSQHYMSAAIENNLNKKEFLQVLRCSIYGQTSGPQVAKLVNLLGKETTIRRLNAVLDSLNEEQNQV